MITFYLQEGVSTPKEEIPEELEKSEEGEEKEE